MKHRISELEGESLDAAVALAEGWTLYRNKRDGWTVRRPDGTSYEIGNYPPKFDPETGKPLAPMGSVTALAGDRENCFSSDWELGGAIIEREHIDLEWVSNGWRGSIVDGSHDGWFATECGPTPLIAAMRTYVSEKFGKMGDEEIELEA